MGERVRATESEKKSRSRVEERKIQRETGWVRELKIDRETGSGVGERESEPHIEKKIRKSDMVGERMIERETG